MYTFKSLPHIIASTALASFAFGQQVEENIFLDRKYWSAETTIEQINQSIKEGYDLAGSNSNSFDAFYFALNSNVKNSVLKFIVDYPGNGPHKLTHDGRTNLFWSAYFGNTEMVNYFLLKGAKTDVLDEKGLTPMLFALTGGRLDVAIYDLFDKYGSNFKTEVNRDGANAILLAAVHAKDLSFIDYLIKKGNSIKSLDKDGNGIIEYAMMGGNIELSKLLIANKKVKPVNNNAVLFAAMGLRNKQNSVNVYKYIKEELNLPLTTLNGNNQNVTHIIAGKSVDIEIFKYLKGAGVDFSLRDKKGNTVIHYAAKSQKENSTLKEIIQLSGMALDDKNDIGALPFHYATEGNNVIALDLFAINAEVIKSSDSNHDDYISYLITGSRGVNEDLKSKTDFFLKKEMYFDSKQSNGNTLMHLLAQKGDHKIVEFFVKKSKCDINQKNDLGLTPLHIVAMNAKTIEDIQFWINQGADSSITTEIGETTFDLAAENELLKDKINELNFLK